MRKRFQKGSLKKRAGSWIAQYWEYGHRRSQKLGRISEMTKAKAQAEPAVILAPIGEPGFLATICWNRGLGSHSRGEQDLWQGLLSPQQFGVSRQAAGILHIDKFLHGNKARLHVLFRRPPLK